MGFGNRLKNLFRPSENFKYLDDLIHSGVKKIVLDRDIVFDIEEKSEYLDGINLDVDDFVIDGNGHAIDAKGKTRIFKSSGRNITIKNLILRNGHVGKNGGAIRNEGNLTVTDSNFIGNQCSEWGGGAIFNEGMMVIKQSNFDSNTMQESYSDDIYNDGILTLKDSNFDNIKNHNKCYLGNEEMKEKIENNGKIYSYNPLSNNEKSFTFLSKLFDENHSEVILDYDIRLDWNEEDEQVFHGIKIVGDEIVIDGKGHIIDACDKTQIFQCIGKNITIKNITLKNGFCDGEGGAIRNDDGELTVCDSIFIDNCASGGGAIFNAGRLEVKRSTFTKNAISALDYDLGGGAIHNRGDMTILESTFIQNLAESDSIVYSYGVGGAIYNENGKLSIRSSTLRKNMANIHGGAICNTGELSISESVLNENTVGSGIGGEGAAIYNSGELNISESLLNENGSSCGAIYNDGCATIYINEGSAEILKSQFNNNMCAVRSFGGKITISKSTLTNNYVTIVNSNEFKIIQSIFTHNGRIYNYGDLTIKESLFNDTQATEEIMYNNGNLKILNCEISDNQYSKHIILNNDSLNVYNTNFNNNHSKHIILNTNDKSNLSIFYSEFRENDVEKSVIFNDGRSCTIEKTTFENNLSNKNSNNIINKSELSLINPKLNDNGKTILNEKQIIIRNSMTELESKIYGEGIVISSEDLIQQSQNFNFGYLDKKIHENNTKEIILEENICIDDYEIDYYEGGIELDIDNLVIDGNGKTIDAKDKTRIFIITGRNITLKNITFKNGHIYKNYENSLNNNGGAIKINHKGGATLKNCKFINNISEIRGGAIHNNGELHISDSTLDRNEGGAILNVGVLYISESDFESNISAHGGTIFNHKGNVIIMQSTFAQNQVKSGAGAIFNYDGKLSISKSFFYVNAGSKGGAIYNSGDLDISDCSFADNNASQGGAISNTEELKITKSKLYENNANKGGAVYNLDGNLSIRESTLTKNKADSEYGHGGAVYNEKGDVILYRLIINENSSTQSAGATYNENGNLNILESTFEDNTALGGGALYNKEGSLIIKESIFSKNIARNTFDSRGGAIYNFKGTINIMKSTLTKNIANGDYHGNGGVIYNQNGELNITDSEFTENNAKDYGGAIYLEDSKKYELNNCIFKDNSPNDVFNDKE